MCFQTVMCSLAKAMARPDDLGGVKGWVNKQLRKRAGGTVPSANRITLLRDADGDGMAHEISRAAILEFERASGRLRLFASSLRNPNGMARARGPVKAVMSCTGVWFV